MWTGFVLGLVVAAQVGPVTLLIVRSVLRGGRAVLVGLAMAAAVALIDLLYAALGLAGIGRLLSGDVVRLAFGLVSAAILIAIGARTIWAGFRARLGLEDFADVVEPRRAFVTATAATALNPLTIALWTVTFPAAAPAAGRDSVGRALLLLGGVALGSLSWYCALSTALALARSRLNERLLGLVDVGAGGGLVALGGLLAYRSARDY
jgi:putative LysE/RhtB family amino acid efflux pump